MRRELGFQSVVTERLIHGREHLRNGEFIEALAAAVEMAFAAELLAGQARQGILHHPDVTATLDCAGVIPRPRKASHRPRADQSRAGRTVKGHSGATTRGGQMGDRGIRPDIDGSAAQE